MSGILIYAGICAVIVGFLAVRRVSENGVRLPRRAPRPAPHVTPLTRTELLALAKRDYFDQVAESKTLGLDREEQEALQKQIYENYLNRIGGLFS